MASKTRTAGRIEKGFIFDIVLDVSEREGETSKVVAQVTDHWNFNPKATMEELKESIETALQDFVTVEQFANRFNYGHDVKERQDAKAGTREKTGVKAQLKQAETKKAQLIALARQKKIDGDSGLYDSLVQLEWIKE